MNDLTIPDNRKAIEALQAQMATMPQVDIKTEHYFCDDMYLRKVSHAAGILIVGKVLKKSHFALIAKGRIQIGRKVLEAGDVMVCSPGTKRAAIALEDSVFITIHHTKKKNLDKIEKELTERDDTALFDARNEIKAKELT